MAIGTNMTAYAALSKQSMFLVWGPPSHGPRSKVFARELGIDSLYYIYATTRRGVLIAPIKYTYQAIKTLYLLFSEHPRVIFVQSPPSFAVLFVFVYCWLTGAKYLIDTHSDALQRSIWTKPTWLYQFLARQAVATIVTNEHFRDKIQRGGARAFVLRDIPTTFDRVADYPLDGHFNIVVVNTFAKDEPLREVLAAAQDLPDVQFYVTGKKQRSTPDILAHAPANVHFTDFLPDEAYYALLSAAQAVMCLTKRDHTMQRGACEALSLGKPVITSDWPVLRGYFRQGAIFVPNTTDGIRRGVLHMMEEHAQFQQAIKALQTVQRREWQEKIERLTNLVHRAVKVD